MEFILAILYSTHQILRNGNLDLYYLVSCFLIIFFLIKKRSLLKESLFRLLPFIILAIPIIIFSPVVTSYFKIIINIIKIYLNIILLIYVKEYIQLFNLRKFLKYLIVLYFISLAFAFIMPNSDLWRHNDHVNSFTTTRLQLFNYEPSELGFEAGIIIIFILYCLYRRIYNNKYFISLAILGLLMFLAAGMNAIICLFLAILSMCIVETIRKVTLPKMIFWTWGAPIIIIIILLFLLSDFSYAQRIMAILNGEDSSFNYRYTRAIDCMYILLNLSKGLGVGPGNLNTNLVRNILVFNGMDGVFANSFMYFIVEYGYAGLVFLIIFNLHLLNKSFYKKNMLKVALFIYIFFYQIGGGYFTNPTIWIIFGIILSKNTEGIISNNLNTN